MLEEWLEELGFNILEPRETTMGFAFDSNLALRYTWEWLQVGTLHTFDRWSGHTIACDLRITEPVGVEITLPTDRETLTLCLQHWQQANQRFIKDYP